MELPKKTAVVVFLLLLPGKPLDPINFSEVCVCVFIQFSFFFVELMKIVHSTIGLF